LELGLLFLAYMAEADSPEARHQYEWFGEQAKNLGLELPTRELPGGLIAPVACR